MLFGRLVLLILMGCYGRILFILLAHVHRVHVIPLIMDVQNIVTENHIYKRVWAPVIGEELSVFPEENDIHDRHAVSVSCSL